MISFPGRRKADDPGDSGSLNDLSFILIIFFIVIAGFSVNKGFLVTLPNTDRPRIVQSEDLIKCQLDRNANIRVDDEVINLGKLEQILREKKESWPNMTFLLSIDPDCPWQNVVNIIHEVRKLNIENFSFRMSEESPNEGRS
ncbi:MAG TPA: biopolymer transporter ExbD [Treponemataceae bacterium]|nr:biopolymer transporter ExbD [Treponemataceae bacterium]